MIDESFRVNLISSLALMNETTPMTHRNCIDTSWRFPTSLPRILEAAAPRQLVPDLLSRFRAWRERARSRHLLLQLDDRMLRDVGLSRSDVDCECAKHFWQP